VTNLSSGTSWAVLETRARLIDVSQVKANGLMLNVFVIPIESILLVIALRLDYRLD